MMDKNPNCIIRSFKLPCKSIHNSWWRGMLISAGMRHHVASTMSGRWRVSPAWTQSAAAACWAPACRRRRLVDQASPTVERGQSLQGSTHITISSSTCVIKARRCFTLVGPGSHERAGMNCTHWIVWWRRWSCPCCSSLDSDTCRNRTSWRR